MSLQPLRYLLHFLLEHLVRIFSFHSGYWADKSSAGYEMTVTCQQSRSTPDTHQGAGYLTRCSPVPPEVGREKQSLDTPGGYILSRCSALYALITELNHLPFSSQDCPLANGFYSMHVDAMQSYSQPLSHRPSHWDTGLLLHAILRRKLEKAFIVLALSVLILFSPRNW